MQASSTCDVRVEGGGGQVAAHSGLFALGRFADGLGLGEALSAAVPPGGERAPSHDRGKVLAHLLLMLAGGGEACSDIEHLRAQPVLFGEVASDSTLYRTLRGLGPDVVEGLLGAVAGVRAGVWERRGEGSGPVVLDIDSTLVEVHSENKQGAAAHFKGGFGFHPMLCATSEGEPLSIKLRAGNAAANDICDHIEVLDAAIAQLPAAVAGGHREGDGQAPLREVHLRVDAAGCSVGIAEACRARNIGFFMTARSNHQVEAAIDHNRFDAGAWQPALGAGGEPSRRAQVADLTDSVDLSGWPAGTRFIARREPLHPGAQRTLFDSGNRRYRGFYTDAEGGPAELDAHMRAHARIENTIADLKDSGLKRMPFTDYEANAAWAQLVALSLALVRWFQQLRLTGPLAQAAPKRLRWQLWHAPARLVRSSRKQTLRLLDWWPTTPQLLHACQPHAP
ncbi:IS1380 family transposase [Candidatus Poriferisocius sp.]|uniref:IS1380 family transposase n=2 Tax=Candidatus Poriferisocius sp. TaxID=3101276 RepID=UPI003B01225E